MSKVADYYREQAALEVRFAAETTLPNVRAMHQASARRWIEMAEQIERMAR